MNAGGRRGRHRRNEDKKRPPALSGGRRYLGQHRIIRQERFAADFASEKGAKTQESFVDFKFEQRISGVKDAVNRRRRYCAVLP